MRLQSIEPGWISPRQIILRTVAIDRVPAVRTHRDALCFDEHALLCSAGGAHAPHRALASTITCAGFRFAQPTRDADNLFLTLFSQLRAAGRLHRRADSRTSVLPNRHCNVGIPLGRWAPQEDLMLLYIWFATVTDPLVLWRAMGAEPSRAAGRASAEASPAANESAIRCSPALPNVIARLPSTASAARTPRTGRAARATMRARRPAAAGGSSRNTKIHWEARRARCAEHGRTA
jgi:hypothetical protein